MKCVVDLLKAMGTDITEDLIWSTDPRYKKEEPENQKDMNVLLATEEDEPHHFELAYRDQGPVDGGVMRKIHKAELKSEHNKERYEKDGFSCDDITF
jgi:hypothetical protein